MRISTSDSTPTSHTMATSTAAPTSAVSTVISTSTATTCTNGHTATPPTKPHRDSSWLELEVCREYQRQNCPRSSEECRFAHPDPRFIVKDGKVTCCYDFLKNRCRREQCKFFHPPIHIKQQLISAGKQFGAMMSSVFVMPGGGYYSPLTTMPPVSPSAVPIVGTNGQMVNPLPAPAFIPAAVMSPYGMTDQLHICPEFLRGQCLVQLCPFVHPESQVRCNVDSTVTICRDYVRGGCQRPHCRYFHPPPHIAAQIASASTMPGFIHQVPGPGFMMSPNMMTPGFPPVVYPVAPTPITVPVTPIPAAPIPTSVVPIFPSISSAVPFPVPPPQVPINLPSPVVPVPVSMETPPSPEERPCSFTNGCRENSNTTSVMLQQE